MYCFGKSGAMEYDCDVLYDGGKRFRSRAVALCKSHFHALKPALMKRIPHQAGYSITVLEKPFDKMTSYKAGSTRNQYPS
jgi:hypothetical protein